MDDLAAARRRFWYILTALGLLLFGLFVDSELSRFSLITQVPWIVKGPAIGLGMFGGLLLSIRTKKQHKKTGRETSWRDVIGLLAMPLVFAPVGSYVGRRVFEIAAFAESVGKPAGSMEAVITDLSSRRKQLFGPKVRLEIAPGLRDFWLPIDHRPSVTAIGLMCLEMQAERGRYGALRTEVPAGFDTLRLGDFKACSPNVLKRYPALAERVARIAARNQR